MPTFRTGIKGQRQSPESAPRDVPITHMAEPVSHTSSGIFRDPLNTSCSLLHRLSDLVGPNKPFIIYTKHEFFATSPTMWISMLIRVRPMQQISIIQIADYICGDLASISTCQPTKTINILTVLVDGNNDRKTQITSEIKVFFSRTRGNVDNTCTFFSTNLFPRNHLVHNLADSRQIIEWTVIGPTNHLGTLHPTDHLKLRV